MSTATGWTAMRLLDLLYAPCAGVIEVRAKPVHDGNGSPRCFLAHDDAHRLTQFVGNHLHGHHVFFGVATRRDASSGMLHNCAELPAMFCDLDFKHTPEAVARERLYEFPLPPSAVVLSGNGLHVYWMLREPLLLPDPGECTRAKSLLRRLAHVLGADLQSAEPAHCLRLPGTLNPKYDPPRQARLDHLADEAELQYHASEFDDLLPPEPVETRSNGAFVAPETIRDGERNATLYKLARSLKAKRLDPDSIRAALHVENRKKCAPPLPDDEVDRMIEHAWTQPDRAAFLPKGTPTPRRAREADDDTTPLLTPFEIITPRASFITTYIEYASMRTDAPLEAHEAMAFGILSALAFPIRLPIATNLNGWPLVLWFLYLVNSTEGRKTTTLDLAVDEIRVVLGDAALIHWEGSPQGLLQKLQSRDGLASVFKRDEYSGLMAQMNRGGHLAGLPQLLIKAHDGAVLENIRTKKKGADGATHTDTDRVEHPYLVQLAAAPWDAFCERATLDNVLDGFVARFVIVVGAASGRALPMVTDAILAAGTAVYDHAQAYHQRAQTIQSVVMGPHVLASQWALEQAYRDRATASARPDAAGPSLKRLAETALKLAALLALDEATGTVLTIHDAHFRVATQITDRWLVHALRLIEALGRTTFQKNCEAILTSVQARPSGLPLSTLYRMHRQLKEKDFNEILGALETQEQIVIDKPETGRGRPALIVRPWRAR
ncbi:MAG: primase alpha helix C-terminal domain-containing protein [Nitrospirota bacterium]|nr:primase alpha helix C-terminal domain-containing protein [Nitrospirota bacterium]